MASPILDPLNGALPRFTEEQIEDICFWFDENAEPLNIAEDGPAYEVITIPKFSFFLGLRRFHPREFRYPQRSEIVDEMKKLHSKNLMTKEIFLFMLDKFVKVADVKHELQMAFEIFDVDKNAVLDIDEIKTIVNAQEDQLDSEELTEFFRDINVKGDGIIAYNEFIERMFTTVPELKYIKPKFLFENPNDDPSVATAPIPESTTTIKSVEGNEECAFEDKDQATTTVAPSDVSDIAPTKDADSSVKNDDRGYEADVDDLPYLTDDSVPAPPTATAVTADS